jgi:hypothetical protein
MSSNGYPCPTTSTNRDTSRIGIVVMAYPLDRTQAPGVPVADPEAANTQEPPYGAS